MKSGSIVALGTILISLLLRVWNPVEVAPVSAGYLDNSLDSHSYFQAAPEAITFFADGSATKEDMAACKVGIEEALNRLPLKIASELKVTVLNFDRSDPRGLADSSRIILRCDKPQPERLRVFIHEMGHVAYFNTEQTIRDEFGSLFENSFHDSDFVSGYAKENEFEDFAESFLAFVEFGASFRNVAADNEMLAAKYEFIEKYFLTDRVYQGITAALEGENRVFDLTKAL